MKSKLHVIVLLVSLIFSSLINTAVAASNNLNGRILIQVEDRGKAWYVNPKDGQKYYMENGVEAFEIMKKLGVGISNRDLEKIKKDVNFRKKFIGKILLQVESRGEAYYISFDGRYNYLKDGSSAYEIMRKLGLGISNYNLNKIIESKDSVSSRNKLITINNQSSNSGNNSGVKNNIMVEDKKIEEVVIPPAAITSSTLNSQSCTVKTVTDIDNNVYNTVKIGSQCWFKENLKTTRYRDGGLLGTDFKNKFNQQEYTGSYAWYDNDVSNKNIYGALYNWYAVVDSKGLCPTGWHVASDAEYKILEMYAGMTQVEVDKEGYRGTNEGVKLKSTNLWRFASDAGTDDFGFSAVPAGYLQEDSLSPNKGFASKGVAAFMWTSTPHAIPFFGAYPRVMSMKLIWRQQEEKAQGYSVRCIQE